MIKPFSILDTRLKEWKNRKTWWLNTYNIQSELGREDTESKSGFWESTKSVSVFDPVLCENMYTWFCPPKGRILDPFAGGSVRGIVAEELGYTYIGIDLSKKQIEANKLQSWKPTWIVGDAVELVPQLEYKYDFVFTCPPYHDLEIYSDNPQDLSNMDYSDFLMALDTVINESAKKLYDNRFFAIVVSEIRDLGSTRNYKIGKYKGFVSDVVKMCESHNLNFYNDMILYNSQHQASRTVDTYFNRNRKCASVHQNVLVFIKGNPDIATEDITWDGTYKCIVNGNEYKSFREAAIDINPIELVASEVERRCKSPKSKYKEWQIIGEETKPNIKFQVDGIPFESFKQAGELMGITENMVSTYLNSKNPLYRHWIRTSKWDISYDELNEIHKKGVSNYRLPIIECDGLKYYSLKEAGRNLGVSDERIRQKILDDKFPTYRYLYK